MRDRGRRWRGRLAAGHPRDQPRGLLRGKEVAGDDKYAPSAIAYAGACREAKVPCDFTKTERGGHGFGLKPVLPPDVKDWPDKLHAFLDGLK
jgi:hypothetical protein